MRIGNEKRPSHLVVACFVLALAAGIGCGGGGGGSTIVVGPPPTASFTPSGTPAAPNGVFLQQVSASGTVVTVEVELGGPTSSSDFYSFAFDLVLGDASVAQFVPNSAEVGTALTTTGGQTLAADAAQSGGRVIVGVTKLGGGAGNGLSAAEASVVRLTFRVLKAGMSTISFSGSVSPSNPTGLPVALDSGGVPIGSVTFDAVSATITGS
jgi:hypothetical protein